MKTYTFKFKNRRPINECSFVNLTMGIISIKESDTDDEVSEQARAFWHENGITQYEDKEKKPWGRYCLSRRGEHDGVALFVIQNLKNPSWAIDFGLEYMRVYNGIEPTFQDYKRINMEFEKQFEKDGLQVS